MSNAESTASSQAPATGKAEPLLAHQVAPAAKAAYQGASAVHIKASLGNSGSTMTFDLQLNTDSASGTVVNDGTEVQVVSANGVCYGQITDALITKMGMSPTSGPGAALRNKWVSSETPFGSHLPSGLKEMLSYNTFVPKLLGALDTDTLRAAGSDTVNGVPVFAFNGADGSTTFHVAASTPHYLMRTSSGGASGSALFDFTGWNHPVAVTAPPASEIYLGPGA